VNLLPIYVPLYQSRGTPHPYRILYDHYIWLFIEYTVIEAMQALEDSVNIELQLLKEPTSI
jgi:hypothetical protein